MDNKLTPRQLIDKHNITAPVDVEKIANEFGLKVMYANLGSDISGAIKKDNLFGGESVYLILVNQTEAPNRQRFTIAHELAHFLLHKEFIGDGIKENTLYRSTLSGSMESQANKVAANILMPPKLLKVIMNKYNNNLVEVAKELEVSIRALEIQLSSYDLWRAA